MKKMTETQVLKKINGSADCAAEFILCNREVDAADKIWMLKESNRSFKVWGIPIRAVDVEFERGSTVWHIEEFFGQTQKSALAPDHGEMPILELS